MKGYADLADLPEDDRIAIIGKVAATQITAVFVDNDTIADRYVAKLAAYPLVRLIERKVNVLVNNTVFLKFGPKGH